MPVTEVPGRDTDGDGVCPEPTSWNSGRASQRMKTYLIRRSMIVLLQPCRRSLSIILEMSGRVIL